MMDLLILQDIKNYIDSTKIAHTSVEHVEHQEKYTYKVAQEFLVKVYHCMKSTK